MLRFCISTYPDRLQKITWGLKFHRGLSNRDHPNKEDYQSVRAPEAFEGGYGVLSGDLFHAPDEARKERKCQMPPPPKKKQVRATDGELRASCLLVYSVQM
jgi:hypothetical protein